MAGPSADDAELSARLRVATGRLWRALRQHAVAGLGIAPLSALVTVEQQGSIRLGDLAAAEQVSPSTLTRIIAALEEKGLVRREVDEQDKRVAWVSLTPKGKRTLDAARGERTMWLAQRVARLPAEERAALAAAVQALEHLTSAEG